MKAVVRVGGKQYIVTEKESLLVDLLPEGTKELTLEPLMVFDGKDATIGAPLVSGLTIKAKVLEDEVKGEKLQIIRYKSKKRVHKVTGHRQKYSRIEVGSIKKAADKK
jgi:large subunit ribosomal protein L21